MPYIRKAIADAGVVPPELLDPEDDVWLSVESVRRWYTRNGVAGQVAPYGPHSRHHDAVEAWAFSCGMVRQFGQNPMPCTDWNAVRAAGIDHLSCSRAIRERINYTRGS